MSPGFGLPSRLSSFPLKVPAQKMSRRVCWIPGLKLRKARKAPQLESRLSKREILELYIDRESPRRFKQVY